VPMTFVMFVHLSACSSTAPTGHISLKFNIGTFMKICQRNADLVKMDKTIAHIGPKYILLLPVITIRHKSPVFN
jgi:hypothetical protein